MDLVLKIDLTVLDDATEVAVEDSTQTYVDGESGGWGVSGNSDRADKCLLCFCKYTDKDGNDSYFDFKDKYVSTDDKSYAIEDGTGLDNTYKSLFTVLTTADGHHSIYMIPVDRAATAPTGANQYDLIYLTGSSKVQVYDSSWADLSVTDLPNIGTAQGVTSEEELYDLRTVMNRNELVMRLGDDVIGDDNKVMDVLDELNALIEGAHIRFGNNQKETARKILYEATVKDITV
jgi:hypothetical protein